MKRTDIYERAEDWNARGDKLRLRPGEWMLLEAVDGWHTIGEILEAGEWDEPSTEASLEKLLKLGLIRQNEYSWEDYCHRFREEDEEESEETAGVEAPAKEEPGIPLTAAAPELVPAAGAPTPEGAAPEAPAFTPAPPELTAAAPAAEEAGETLVDAFAGIAPEPASPPPAAAPVEPLPLREVLDFVMDRAGGGPKGQLAVYRTFLKIPMHQLRESGIKSLNVATSDLMIRDPALQDSLLQAVEAVVGEPFAKG